MSAENLATCWMPSLFRIPHKNSAILYAFNYFFLIKILFLRRRKSLGMPNERERSAYQAIKQVLSRMIRDHKMLLRIPPEMAREIGYSSGVLQANFDLQMPLKNGFFDFNDQFHLFFKKQLNLLKWVNFTFLNEKIF